MAAVSRFIAFGLLISVAAACMGRTGGSIANGSYTPRGLDFEQNAGVGHWIR
jgi:hypothetical protein